MTCKCLSFTIAGAREPQVTARGKARYCPSILLSRATCRVLMNVERVGSRFQSLQVRLDQERWLVSAQNHDFSVPYRDRSELFASALVIDLSDGDFSLDRIVRPTQEFTVHHVPLFLGKLRLIVAPRKEIVKEALQLGDTLIA